MKNTLDEILTMMGKIDPSYSGYVDEEGDAVNGNGLGFVYNGEKFFEDRNIYRTVYDDQRDFPEILRLIQFIKDSNGLILEDLMAINKKKDDKYSVSFDKKLGDYERYSIFYTIKSVITGVLGNANNPRPIVTNSASTNNTETEQVNESENFDAWTPDDDYFKDATFSTSVRNFKVILKQLIMNLFADCIFYVAFGNGDKDDIYRRFIVAASESMKASKKEIQFIFWTVWNYVQNYVQKNGERFVNEFQDAVTVGDGVDRGRTVYFVDLFEKEWASLIDYINGESFSASDKLKEEEYSVLNYIQARLSIIYDILMSCRYVNSDPNSAYYGTGQTLTQYLLHHNNMTRTGANAINPYATAFVKNKLRRFSPEDVLKYYDDLVQGKKMVGELNSKTGGKYNAIVTGLEELINEMEKLNKKILKFKIWKDEVVNWYESGNAELQTKKGKPEEVQKAKDELVDMGKSITEFFNLLDNPKGVAKQIASAYKFYANKRQESSILDTVQSEDFIYMDRGMKTQFISKLINCAKNDNGLSQVFISGQEPTQNITAKLTMYSQTIRKAFPGENYRILRPYLYYLTNRENYCDSLRKFLYGEECLTSSDIWDANLIMSKNVSIDDPAVVDNVPKKEICNNIRTLFAKRLMESDTIEKSYVDKIKTLKSDIEKYKSRKMSYGKALRNSASIYDHAQDIIVIILKGNYIADRVRAAYMSSPESRMLYRSLELVFGHNVSATQKALTCLGPKWPLYIMENKSVESLKLLTGMDRVNVDRVINMIYNAKPKKKKKTDDEEEEDDNEMVVFTKDELGVTSNAAGVLDLFIGTNASVDFCDKDKTNARIAAEVNDIAENYSMQYVRNLNMKNAAQDVVDVPAEETPELNESRNGNASPKTELEAKFQKCMFKRELNSKTRGNEFDDETNKEAASYLGNLSVDIVNIPYKIAIEYQGPQHYVAEGVASPIQSTVRRAEFFDTDRTKAYIERRNEYLTFVQNEMKNGKRSLNGIKDDYIKGIVAEFDFYRKNNEGKDKYGIKIDDTPETINLWLRYFKMGGGGNPDDTKDKIHKQLKATNGAMSTDVDYDPQSMMQIVRANTIARWGKETDAWTQQLKDKGKLTVFLDILKSATKNDGNNPSQDSIPSILQGEWTVIHLVDSHFERVMDKEINGGEMNPNALYNALLNKKTNPEELRDLIYEWEYRLYYGDLGLNYYIIAGKEKGGKGSGHGIFKTEDKDIFQSGNFFKMSYPSDETSEKLEDIITSKYTDYDKRGISESRKRTMMTLFEEIVRQILK